MKRILISFVLCLALVSVGLAQQNPADAPATKADVEKYLQAMHSHDMMLQMMDAMAVPMHKMMHEQYMKDKDRLPADFEARMNKIMDDMLQGLPWDDILQATVPVYQKHFTRGDLEAAAAFYSSPAGQKLLREMPSLLADTMEVMMPVMQKHLETVGDRVRQQVAEMLKESETAPAATKN